MLRFHARSWPWKSGTGFSACQGGSRGMIERVSHLLTLCQSGDSVMPPTELFNEGWLLRLTLDWYSEQPPSTFPLAFEDNARWYSEGLLSSPFLARYRKDTLAEGFTHADGVIGHFDVTPGERSEIRARRDSTQLVVVEAKLGSPLSSGTRNAPDYDQAARNTACLAHLLAQAGRSPNALSRAAFYVIAPKIQVENGVFGALVTKESICAKVKARVAVYEGEKDEWFETALIPALTNLTVDVMTWEDILEETKQTDFGSHFREFYSRCLELVPRISSGLQ